MKKLWIVTVENWDYDLLESAAVWAKDEDEAMQVVRDWDKDQHDSKLPKLPTFTVEPAPRSGMALANITYG